MNSVGGHVVAALRPDPRIVHEIERTHSPERMVQREQAQYGVTSTAMHALGPSLTLCPGQISNIWRRCYSRPSTPSRNARKEDVLGRLLPTGHRLKIAAPVRKGTGPPRFMAPRIHQTCNTPSPSRPKDPSGLFMAPEDLHARGLSL